MGGIENLTKTYFSETWKSLPDSSFTDFCTALKENKKIKKILRIQYVLLDSPGKSLKDALHISALLHGDDP